MTDWISPTDRAAYPGNILDRLAALEWQAKQALARPVQAQSLAEIATDMGVQTAGMFVAVGDGTAATNPTDAVFSGCFMSGTSVDFGAVGKYNIGGVNAGVLQCGMSATDGQFYFGAGAGTLGVNGATIISQTTTSDVRAYKFSDGVNIIGGMYSAANIGGQNFVVIKTNSIAGLDSYATLTAFAPAGQGASITLSTLQNSFVKGALSIQTTAAAVTTLSATADIVNLCAGMIYATSSPQNVGIAGVPRQQLSVGAYLDIYSGVANSPTVSSIRASSTGIIINAPTTGVVFLARDSGTGGVLFGDGATNQVAMINGAGHLFLGGNTAPAVTLQVLGGVSVGGDDGGIASYTSLTNVTSAVSTGVGTVLCAGTTVRSSTGWMKIYIGTAVRYVPYWTTIT